MQKTLEKRLAKLPPKVALPLKHLAKIGQMQDKDIRLVLDAGDLVGNHTHLLGFAAGAMGMAAERVPIHDTVSMAKKLGARIQLDWTPRRWREEHDKLAKRITLHRFRQKNVDYDVSSFEALLPATYPGYLIRTSLRLATVGWHQRHCVASYHKQVVSGACAIACVFINKTRWTVDLRKNYGVANSLRINMICTTDNKIPDPFTSKAIHECLNIQESPRYGYHRYQRDIDLRESVTSANLARVRQSLLKAGIDKVCVQQDSDPTPLGSLPDFYCEPQNVSIEKLELELYDITPDRDENDNLVCQLETVSLKKSVELLTDELISKHRAAHHRWRTAPLRQHAVLELDVKTGVISIRVAESNSLSPRAVIKTRDEQFRIDDNPEVDLQLAA